MKWCKKCVTPHTRPRIEFDEHGVCNACLWHEQKMQKNWEAEQRELRKICDFFRRRNGEFDVIVPCSGGKDGSYVAWKLKHELGMHPLCVTFTPPLPTPIGRRNLENFINSGFDHLRVSPDPAAYRAYNKESFINRGMPKQAFVTGISTALFNIAMKFDIRFLMYGEQGELEYGGKQETGLLKKMDRDFLIKIYYEGEDPGRWGYWWKLPPIKEIYATWWSLYEHWDPDEHARLAKEKCGMELLVGGSIGTFTNGSQLDDMMQDLHVFMQFVKFGFGRATSDASIEIRQGRMTREQGVEVVNKLDGTFPLEYLPVYLSYFEMSEKEFFHVVAKHVNHSILVKNPMNDTRPFILKDPVR